jgi:hypothetical protein
VHDGDTCVVAFVRNVISNIAHCENNMGNLIQATSAINKSDGYKEEIDLEVRGGDKERDGVCTDIDLISPSPQCPFDSSTIGHDN